MQRRLSRWFCESGRVARKRPSRTSPPSRCLVSRPSVARSPRPPAGRPASERSRRIISGRARPSRRPRLRARSGKPLRAAPGGRKGGAHVPPRLLGAAGAPRPLGRVRETRPTKRLVLQGGSPRCPRERTRKRRRSAGTERRLCHARRGAATRFGNPSRTRNVGSSRSEAALPWRNHVVDVAIVIPVCKRPTSRF